MTAQLEADFPELVDPVFQAKVAAYVAADDESHAAWLAKDQFDALIDDALSKAKMVFAASAGMPEEESPRWTLAVIDLSHRRAKPLVQALARRSIGQSELWSTYTWDVDFGAIMGRRSAAVKTANSAQRHATVEVFALALSVPGFELAIWRE